MVKITKAIEQCIKSFNILEDLEAKKLLEVDLVNLQVYIDYRLHLEFFESDDRYLNFMSKVRAWMNFRRGFLQVRKTIYPEDRIDFYVFRQEQAYFSGGGEIELCDIFGSPDLEIKERKRILLVGFVQGGQIDYAPVPERPEEEIEELD